MSEAYFYLGDRAQAQQWQMRSRRDFNDPIEVERMRVKGLMGSMGHACVVDEHNSWA